MKDPIARLRKKSRFIAEVRYEAVPQFFDRRGEIIGELHPKIQDPFERWTTNPGQVLFLDRMEAPTAEWVITHQKMALILEDKGNLPTFLDQVDKYWGLAFGFLKDWVGTYTRIGFRVIEVLESRSHRQSKDVVDLLLERFHRLPGLDLTYSDSMVKLVHDQGWWQVGPATEGEAWVAAVFKTPTENMPKAGFGIDIDSFAKDVDVDDVEEATAAIRTVATLTKSVEEHLVDYLGLLDD